MLSPHLGALRMESPNGYSASGGQHFITDKIPEENEHKEGTLRKKQTRKEGNSS